MIHSICFDAPRYPITRDSRDAAKNGGCQRGSPSLPTMPKLDRSSFGVIMDIRFAGRVPRAADDRTDYGEMTDAEG